MKTIVFIGTQKSGSSREAIKAAERLGYYTVLLTDRTTFIEKRTEFPDVHLMQMCDLNNIEGLKDIIGRLQLKALDISAIVSFVDPYCHTACILSEELGINRFTTVAIGNMLNKIRSREILSHTPYAPYFSVFTEHSKLKKIQIEKYLPIIMKSPNSTGSKDVFKINNFKEFKHYLKKLLNKYPDEPVLVEEFLDGPQYLVETIFYENKLHIIAIFKQEITFVRRFIVTGYNLIVNPDKTFLDNLKKAVEDIIRAHGMEQGPCHLEMRLVNNQWKLIEANPRISGGAMNRIIETALGINLVEETLKIALGEKPNLEPKYINHTFTQYVIVSETGVLEKVTGRNKAAKCPGVQWVYIKPRKGSILTPPLSMGNRYAYVIAIGETENQARDNAKYAASLIRFSLLPVPKKEQEETSKNTVSADLSSTEESMEGFRNYLVEQGKSSAAVKRDTANAKIYLNWTKDTFNEEGILFRKDFISKYKTFLMETKGLRPNTINSKLYSLKRLNRFLVEIGIQNSVIIDKQDMIRTQNKSKALETESICGFKEYK